MTVAQLVAHIDRWEEEREFEVALNARIMYAVVVSSGAKKRGGGKWSLKDFLLPSRREREGRGQGRPKPVEQLVTVAKQLNAMWGGDASRGQ